jgi:hypothetical protein
MATPILILILLASLPADCASGASLADLHARQAAVSQPSSDGDARFGLIRAEAVDEESEEEEFGGHGGADLYRGSCLDTGSVTVVKASTGPSQLRLARDRRGSPRSPPETLTFLPIASQGAILG